ncbi:MAG: hypothetical protein F6K54_31600 [Okeania sp. SIO3B5]|uniref:hypothetical protein n=1 Tax=Okeania sp. SIO3B5 TaxID=2607811 RepID=UPI00140022CA|nr:hypothetical protein [Okeania sp. SIO3B5]NEO57213.1 hypothetical protein [Okeania sp. SIO3B5]
MNKNNQNVSGNNNITAQGDKSTFNQSQISQSAEEQITTTEVVEILAHLEEKIQSLTTLSEADREKSFING